MRKSQNESLRSQESELNSIAESAFQIIKILNYHSSAEKLKLVID